MRSNYSLPASSVLSLKSTLTPNWSSTNPRVRQCWEESADSESPVLIRSTPFIHAERFFGGFPFSIDSLGA